MFVNLPELVYCDPPYLRETRKKRARLYKYEYSHKDHVVLLEVLKSLPCMVMISGYESALYKESLKSWHTHCFQAACHHGVATEWLWMNYNAPVELHEYRYLGNNFRERERIKRKRWTAKLQSMPILERQALLATTPVSPNIWRRAGLSRHSLVANPRPLSQPNSTRGSQSSVG